MPRQKIIPYDERLSARIKSGKILKRLQDHVFGITELSQTQIRAAQILLNKVMPDIKAIEINNLTNGAQDGLSNESLLRIINGEYERINENPVRTIKNVN